MLCYLVNVVVSFSKGSEKNLKGIPLKYHEMMVKFAYVCICLPYIHMEDYRNQLGKIGFMYNLNKTYKK